MMMIEYDHGKRYGHAKQDIEGLQTMRALARNMTFLMKSIALGKKEYGLPEKECPGSSEGDPCELFSRIPFPVEEFFPPNSVNSTEAYRDML